MRKIEGTEVLALENEVFSLMKAVYEADNGRYPALEWLKDRPVPGEKGWEERFEEIYRPFLRYRLKSDMDVLLTIEDFGLAGVIGIKHTHTGSFEGYERMFSHVGVGLSENAAFLEMLAVHPEHRRKGYGRALLTEALKIVKHMDMQAYGVSFPGLELALHIYESAGADVIAKVSAYSWGEHEGPANYLILRFPSFHDWKSLYDRGK